MSDKRKLAAVVLAAGEGTRMKSRLPKVLHPVAGLPMVVHVLEALRGLEPERIVVVVGHGREQVESALNDYNVLFASQEEQRGTGDAVRSAEPLLAGFEGNVLVVYGDNPLIRTETLGRLTEAAGGEAAASLLTVHSTDPTGYGRIVRGSGGSLLRIVEDRDASDEERLINEVNAGSYCFDAQKLFQLLPQLQAENSKGEYYLTDLIEMLVSSRQQVIPVAAEEEGETLGVDSREKLAKANKIYRDRLVAHFMAEGVAILDPASVWVDARVSIEQDTLLLPQTMLLGATSVGEGCRIGPCVQLEDCRVESGAVIEYAVARSSEIGERAQLGPFCSLRPGSVIKADAKIGTFVETKATILGEGSKIPHLSYFGDAEVGRGVNVGAGSITCNYDGFRKNRTVIEDDVFIGSDTMLVAPVRIGKGAVTGAGAVVRKDVPPEGLAVGVPARNLSRGRKAEREAGDSKAERSGDRRHKANEGGQTV